MPNRRSPEDTGTEEIPVPVDQFTAGDARKAIAVAGLLADRPELRDKQLTETDWQAALSAYLESPRP